MMKAFFSFLLFAALRLMPIESDEKTIRVGMDLTSPPFETIDTKGKPVGIGVEIAEKFCEYMNEQCSIVNIPFIGLIPSLQSDKIDMILSSMTPTYERSKVIAFSNPYLSIGLCLLLSKDSKAIDASSLNSSRYTIVVKTATTGEAYAKSLFPKAKIIILDQEASCISEILQGKADAFLYDQITVYTTWQKYPDKTKVDLTPLKKDYWCVGMKKESTALMADFNKFLKDFAEKGGFTELKKKYLQKEEMAFEKLKTPLIFAPTASESP